MYPGCGFSEQRSTITILVIDGEESTANAIAANVPRGSCEIIWCRDIALAEVAVGLTEFDLILVAPESTGVDGPAGLGVADFLATRNPNGITTLLLPDEDGDLRAVVEQRGFHVLSKPLVGEQVTPFIAGIAQGLCGVA